MFRANGTGGWQRVAKEQISVSAGVPHENHCRGDARDRWSLFIGCLLGYSNLGLWEETNLIKYFDLLVQIFIPKKIQIENFKTKIISYIPKPNLCQVEASFLV